MFDNSFFIKKRNWWSLIIIIIMNIYSQYSLKVYEYFLIYNILFSISSSHKKTITKNNYHNHIYEREMNSEIVRHNVHSEMLNYYYYCCCCCCYEGETMWMRNVVWECVPVIIYIINHLYVEKCYIFL